MNGDKYRIARNLREHIVKVHIRALKRPLITECRMIFRQGFFQARDIRLLCQSRCITRQSGLKKQTCFL